MQKNNPIKLTIITFGIIFLLIGVVAIYSSDMNAPGQKSCNNSTWEKGKVTVEYDKWHEQKCVKHIEFIMGLLDYKIQNIDKVNDKAIVTLSK